MKKNDFLYNASLKTYHDRILNKGVNCVIDKLAVFFLSVSFAGRNRHRKQVPDNGQCVINFRYCYNFQD